MFNREDEKVQEFVHKIEAGSLKVFVTRSVLAAAVAAVAALYLFYDFRGLETETAMDQAQVGRQIASGAGFSTLYVRPLALEQLRNAGKWSAAEPFPDTYNFPLNPVVNALALRPFKRWWHMENTDLIYAGDRAIAAVGVVLFLAAVGFLYFLVREVFDRKIAWLAVALTLLTDMMWRFAVSGLPQNLVLLLFVASLFLMHRAMGARETVQTGRMLVQLGGAALLLGLATLAQPLTFWIFGGFLVFVAIWFRPRSVSALLVFFVYLVPVAPWMVRNYLVCGNPFGLGAFAILDGTTGSELFFMRNMHPDLTAFGAVRGKLRGGFTSQFENLFSYLGFNAVAAAFFFAMLHVFKRQATNMLRWALALMWLSAAAGMALFPPQSVVSANQMNAVFVPLFAAYGLAFLLVLWNRLDIRFGPAKNFFIAALCLVTAAPMAIRLLTSPPVRFVWPPYIPPSIAEVCRWIQPGEIICSDMPWATAWYGDRLSLLLPSDVQQFLEISDYKYLGGPVAGIYLTPVSGDRPFLSQIARGEYAEWANYILRRADLDRFYASFPLRAKTALPVDGSCIFYSDSERWKTKKTP